MQGNVDPATLHSCASDKYATAQCNACGSCDPGKYVATKCENFVAGTCTDCPSGKFSGSSQNKATSVTTCTAHRTCAGNTPKTYPVGGTSTTNAQCNACPAGSSHPNCT